VTEFVTSSVGVLEASGEINACDQIVIENQKKAENMEVPGQKFVHKYNQQSTE